MPTATITDFMGRLTRQIRITSFADYSDRQLVEQALAGETDAAVAVIVHRHGPMVYRVCWRVLQRSHDAEDAFQATFLVLAGKLRSIRKLESLASWLHGIAHHVALRAKVQAQARRRREESAARAGNSTRTDDGNGNDLRAALDAELCRLPEKLRQPLVLCYLEGRTQDEAASQLGWSKSTLRRRLAKARDTLGRRLTARGVSLSASMAAVLVSECIASGAPAPALVASTVEAAAHVVAGETTATVANATVAALTGGLVKAMFVTKLKYVATAILLVALLGAGAGWFAASGLARTSDETGITPQAKGDVQVPPEPREDLKTTINPVIPGDAIHTAGVSRDADRADAAEQDPSAVSLSQGEKANGKKDLELLQGTWNVDLMEWSGKSLPKELMKGYKFVFDGNKLTWDAAIGMMSKGGKITASDGAFPCDFKIDPTKEPKQIDITLHLKQREGTFLGIYEIKGDTLKVCYYGNKQGKRPTEFSTNDIQGGALGVLTRAKKSEGGKGAEGGNDAPEDPKAKDPEDALFPSTSLYFGVSANEQNEPQG